MPTKEAQPVIDKSVAYLRQHQDIDALVLVGSQVEGNKFAPDKFSDIELYVVVDDEKYEDAEKLVHTIQNIFDKESVLFAYKNQWAGWSVLFANLLRLELPVVKASDENVFSRPSEQGVQILYAKPGFIVKRSEEHKTEKSILEKINHEIMDFWYMATYAVQHVARGEIWSGRDAIRVSMQSKIKKLMQELHHKDSLNLDANRRIELTWNPQELEILRETSSSYDRESVINSFWANIKYAKELLKEANADVNLFEEYEQKLVPKYQQLLQN